jgi:hypothetical protein
VGMLEYGKSIDTFIINSTKCFNSIYVTNPRAFWEHREGFCAFTMAWIFFQLGNRWN